MRATFADTVIDKFVRTYKAGRTPNPCIDCNRHLKFGALLDHARAELDFIATGHYGRTGLLADMPVLDGPAALRRGLRALRPHVRSSRGHAPTKDQSYVLYSLHPGASRPRPFALGRAAQGGRRAPHRARAGFENAGKRDSQGICFVPDDDFASYIETRRGQALPEGDIVDAAGNVLGRHRGAIRYTIGQRKGLGVACAHPVYVTAIDAAANTVTLGDPEDLMATGLVADDWIWSAPADAMEELLDEAGATGLPAGAEDPLPPPYARMPHAPWRRRLHRASRSTRPNGESRPGRPSWRTPGTSSSAAARGAGAPLARRRATGATRYSSSSATSRAPWSARASRSENMSRNAANSSSEQRAIDESPKRSRHRLPSTAPSTKTAMTPK